MKTTHATSHWPVSTTQSHYHRRVLSYDALMVGANTISMVVLLACEVVMLWVLLTAIYFAPWPVQ